MPLPSCCVSPILSAWHERHLLYLFAVLRRVYQPLATLSTHLAIITLAEVVYNHRNQTYKITEIILTLLFTT